MKAPEKDKQVAAGKSKQNMLEVKSPACCEPTCCTSNYKKETIRKEK